MVLANTVILVSLFLGNFVDNKGDDADLQSDEMVDRQTFPSTPFLHVNFKDDISLLVATAIVPLPRNQYFLPKPTTKTASAP